MMQSSLATTLSRKFIHSNSLLIDGALVLTGSLVLAALAQLRILLPLSLVPITGQTLGVLLLGAVLGSRRGAGAVILYIFEGSMGLPFFAGGGAGPAWLLGPTGGYLVGFVVAAFLTGWLAERDLDRRIWTALPAFVAGQAAIYLLGVLWLSNFVGMNTALITGVVPFLIGDAFKITLASGLLPSLWHWVKSLGI